MCSVSCQRAVLFHIRHRNAHCSPLVRHTVRGHGRRNCCDMELRCMIALLDLLSLGLNVQPMLELGTVRFQIWCAAGTKIQSHIKAAHTNSVMAARTIVKVVLYFCPDLL